MKTTTAIIAPRNEFIEQALITQVQGTAPLITNSNPTTFGSTILATTSSTTFEEVSRSKYTVDTNGVITLTEILAILDTGLPANVTFPFPPFPNIPVVLTKPTTTNGVLRVEISGDAGNTFVNMSGDIIGPKLVRATGLWIKKIDTVPDGLQFRFLVKSADGFPATIGMSNQNIVVFVLNKKLT